MANFDLAIEKTLVNEGGYTNDPNDTGGATNYGVTLKVLQGRGSWADFDHDGDIDATDVQLMSIEDAKQVYRELYWNGDNIDSQAIAEKHFDIGVNMGVVTANKLLQKACNVSGGWAIATDGKLGPQSIKALNGCDEVTLMTVICQLQAEKYWEIVLNNLPKNGWADELLARASSLVLNRDLAGCLLLVKELKSNRMKVGNLNFIRGWLNRADQRFGI